MALPRTNRILGQGGHKIVFKRDPSACWPQPRLKGQAVSYLRMWNCACQPNLN